MPKNRANNKAFTRESEADWLWAAKYNATYRTKAERSADVRRARRERARQHPDKVLRPAVAIDLAMMDILAERARSKAALVKLRLERGFQHHGGPVVQGNDTYIREAFTYRGLVSEQHAILELFVCKLRKAKHLKIGDGKASSYTSDSKLLALDAPYVEANKITCGVLRVEIDRVLPWDGDCRNFRVWAGMKGEETPHGPTQGALHSRPAPGPAAGWRGSQNCL